MIIVIAAVDIIINFFFDLSFSCKSIERRIAREIGLLDLTPSYRVKSERGNILKMSIFCFVLGFRNSN